MFKRTMAILMTVVCLFACTAPMAFADSPAACGTYSSPYSGIGAVLGAIVETIKYAVAQQIVDSANARIMNIVSAAQASPQDDAQWAVAQTTREAAQAIEICRWIGVTVVCEYVEYEIDGQIVLIDPLKVIRF